MSPDEHRSRVGRQLRLRMDQLDGGASGQGALWADGGRFLRGLEVLCRGRHGFHMGGTSNLHVYFGDAFLLYIKLDGLDEGRPSLTLSDQHHGALKQGTLDASHLLFRSRIHGVIAALGLENDKRLMRAFDGYRVVPGVPESFFQLIQAQLIDIVQRGEQAQFRPQPPLFSMPTSKPKKRAPALRRSPALLERASEIDRHLSALRDLLSARVGCPVAVSLGEDGVQVTWRDDGSVIQRAGWSFVDVVHNLSGTESGEGA